MRATNITIEGQYAAGGRSSDHLRVLIASESVVLRAGMHALLRDQPVVIIDAVPNLDQLLSCTATKRAQAALVAPIGGLTAKLRDVLTNQSFPLRMVLLLPPAAVKIHSGTLQLVGNIHCLSLQATRDVIVRALIRPAIAPVEGVLTERVSRGPGGRLTPRQQQVLDCLARGLRNCEIAAQLAIREDTVKAHLGAIYRKLKVKSRAEAITVYLEAS
ncbi:MAG: helix-turn-helix transcriptional regulator [Egibacteraceae bacterium]